MLLRRLFFSLVIGLLIALTVGYLWSARDRFFSAGNLQTLLEQTREVITPPPLRGPLDRLAGNLTRAGVLTETNRHRAEDNKEVLRENQLLNSAAEGKLHDMFAKQYFDHVGPDGKGPADWVEGVGYQYIKVGENLALGNFGTDAELVQAWMDSSGHRENILHDDFTEIGIAVGKGTFEGTTTWLAVQTFALPLAACPTPNATLEDQVKRAEATLSTGSAALAQQQSALATAAAGLEESAAEITRLANEGREKMVAGNAKIEEGNRVYQETGSREQAEPYWAEGERLQQEGEALLARARELQEAYNAQLTRLREQQAAYNQQVEELRNVQRQLQQTIAALNQQIKKFNACAQG